MRNVIEVRHANAKMIVVVIAIEQETLGFCLCMLANAAVALKRRTFFLIIAVRKC